MSKKYNELLTFFIALLFSFWVFLFLPHYAQITEADDVYVAGIVVIPALLVSVAVCLILIKNRSWILSLIITSLNSFNAFLAIYITREAILETLFLSNTIYDGKVEYTSFHLFTIGIIPAVLVLLNWTALVYKLKIIKQHN